MAADRNRARAVAATDVGKLRALYLYYLVL